MHDFKLEATPKRSFFFTLFTFIPLLFISFFTLFTVFVTVSAFSSSEFSYLKFFPFFFSIFLTIGLFSMTKVLIWVNFGKETIIINNHHISIKKRFSFKKENHLLKDIKNLRIVNEPRFDFDSLIGTPLPSLHTIAIYAPKLGGRVAFDIGSTSVFLGNFIDDNDTDKLFYEIEKKAPYSYQIIDIEKTTFKNIKQSKNNGTTIIKYKPKKDVGIILAITSIWLILTILPIHMLSSQYYISSNEFNIPKESITAFYVLIGASFLLLLSLLNMIFKHEKLITTPHTLILKKPFQFFFRKKIDLSTIVRIDMMEEIILKRYWAIGKNLKRATYIAKLGDRIKITTHKKTYDLGNELSYPEGLYIKNLVEKASQQKT